MKTLQEIATQLASESIHPIVTDIFHNAESIENAIQDLEYLRDEILIAIRFAEENQ